MTSSDDLSDAARIAIARRRVSRAAGLLREARADLTRLSDGIDTLAVVHVDDEPSVQQVVEIARIERARRGAVDVVILARPADTGPAPPTARDSGRRSTT